MRPAIAAVASALIAGCGISKDAIRPGGVVVIEIVSPGAFKVEHQLFTTESLGFALRRINGSSDVKTLEIRIPASLLKNDNGVTCGRLASVVTEAAGKQRNFFEWTDNDESTKRPIPCELVVLAAQSARRTDLT